VRTTSYYAFLLFKDHRGKTAVRVEADGNKIPAAPMPGRGGRGSVPQQEDPPDLSVSASRQDGQIVATFVNPRHDVDMDIDCALRGATARGGKAQLLHDADINAFNSFEQPDRITIKP